MKLSLSWIFDHIVTPFSRYDVSDIVQRFNKTTAEIEAVHEVHFDKNKFAVGKITAVEQDSVVVHVAEWSKNITLPMRIDAREGLSFIIIQHNKEYRWATCADWHSTKEGLLPAVFVSDQEMHGGWKDEIPAVDYILEVDNKSITHRPDLWGHYGFAREVAAMLKAECKDSNALYEPIKVHFAPSKQAAVGDNSYSFDIKEPKKIKALAGICIAHITPRASVPWMMYKLCLVDARPIDTLVDATNYTMYDIGQPLHAFNADAIEDKKIIARMAHAGEKLTVLDGDTIELSSHDIVIADAHKALSLAGIMGGKHSGITPSVDTILVEAGCFDASTIRHSVARYKKRTDAAARFEKSLDAHQTIFALRRYVTLLRRCGVEHARVSDISAVGDYPQPHVITVFHSFVEHRLGVTLEPKKIESLLAALDFGVVAHKRNNDTEYSVTVPSFRSSKDVRMKEDIVEEIGRTLGYDALTPSTPCIKATISDLHTVYNRRAIKNICSTALRLQEVYTYSLFDEHFLKQIQWQPKHAARVQMPVSENRQQLVTTLLPQLMAVVAENSAHNDELRFFELARVWHYDGATVTEKKSLAGIVYNKKNDVSFYDGKALLEQLFASLRLTVTWHSVHNPRDPWFIPYQTAEIRHDGTVIGLCGLSHPLFFANVALGSACMFELDADFLIAYNPAVVRMVPLSKFPDIVRDISLLVPLSMTVAALHDIIKTTDERIFAVELHDFFQKAEWIEQRAVTFRYTVRDYRKTLTKLESDQIHDALVARLAEHGVQIR